MRKRTSIKKNFVYQMLYEVLVLALPLITSPYVSRVVGSEGIGIFSYSYSVAYYFVLFAMLGLNNYGNRSIAKVRDDQEKLDRTFSGLFYLHSAVSLICIAAYAVYVFLAPKEERLYALIQFVYVLSAIFDISWLYFGLEQFKSTVTRSTIIRLITVVLIFTLVREKDDLWVYCLILAAGMLLSQVALWFTVRNYVSFVKVPWDEIKIHIKPLLILFIPTIAVSLYKYMDKIMIGIISSKLQLGLYENAEKVINIPQTVIGSFGAVMLPKMSYLAGNKKEPGNKEQAKKYISISMQYVMCLSFGMCFGLAAVAQVFAPVFWGKEFTDCGIMIMGLCATMPFLSFANVIRMQYLIPNSKDREYIVSIIAGAVVNLCINGLLIGPLGSNGAVIGTIAAEVMVCMIQVFVTLGKLDYREYLSKIYMFPVFGAVMFLVVYEMGKLMGTGIVTLIVQIITGAALYGALAVGYLYFKKDEILLSTIETLRSKIKGILAR